MKKTKIFKSGNSLTVRIPKNYHIDVEDVYITKFDNKLIIFPEKDKWDVLFDILDELESSEREDFLKERNQSEAQKR